jgi:hypothetical protein
LVVVVVVVAVVLVVAATVVVVEVVDIHDDLYVLSLIYKRETLPSIIGHHVLRRL